MARQVQAVLHRVAGHRRSGERDPGSVRHAARAEGGRPQGRVRHGAWRGGDRGRGRLGPRALSLRHPPGGLDGGPAEARRRYPTRAQGRLMLWWCSARGIPWEWTWQPYLGVWLFVLVIAAAYVRWHRGAGPTETTRARRWSAAGGLAVLWVLLDWPV